ncbi:MAG: diguanylate cyclase [Gammaproteobacteria bacterium]|nr:diguanylate cyclase [Gammaproteobacteria bacterium]
MTNTITGRLLLVLAVGLVMIFLTQVAVRQYVELPALRQLEYNSDARAVNRVRSAFVEQLRGLERVVIDYAAWDESYEFMGEPRDDPHAQSFLRNDVGGAAHRNTRVNGMIFFSAAREVVHATAYDPYSGGPAPELPLDPTSLADDVIVLRHDDPQLAESGLTSANVGIIAFAVAHIVDSSEQLPSRGTLLFWRLIDAAFTADIALVAGVHFELIPLERALGIPELAAKIDSRRIRERDFLPRDVDRNLHWALFDYAGKPIYLVRQPAEPREFDEGLLPFPSMIAFLSSGLLLLLLTVFFSRSFVQRLKQGTSVMRDIRHGGDFGHALPTTAGDELSEMFSHFNALLRHIRDQEQDLKIRNLALAEISQRDAVTGIHNRRYFDETFDRFWRQAARGGRSISVLLIDVDHFKAFNDNYGHQKGDDVLRQVAGALEDKLHRATEFVARYGGEEFGVVLSEISAEDALRVAESLRAAVMELAIPHEHSPCARVVTISVGVASINANMRFPHLELVRVADAALYAAKGQGRNRVEEGGRHRMVIPNQGKVP